MQIESANPTLHTIKVAILGDPEVGKRTLIQKLAHKQNQQIQSPNSLPLCQHPISFQLNSTHGPCQITLIYINLDLKDFDQNQAYRQQILAQLNSCTNAMLLFSLLNRTTYRNIPYYHRAWTMAQQINSSLLISTKIDQQNDIKIKQKQILFHRKKNIAFFNISTKAAFNLFEPLAYLFKKNMQNPNFAFINPQNFIDLNPQLPIPNREQVEKQIYDAATMDFPDDSD